MLVSFFIKHYSSNFAGMGKFTPYKQSLFASVMKRVVYSGEPGATVEFEITMYAVDKHRFNVVAQTALKTSLPESGEYIFDVKKIISPFHTFRVEDMPGRDPHSIKSLLLIFSCNENGVSVNPAYYEFLPIRCSEKDDNNFAHTWVTFRPQTHWTTPDSYEPLVMSLLNFSYNAVFYMARCYFHSSRPETFVLASKKGYLSGNTLQYIDCSYSAVSAKASEKGLNDTIMAYDIYPLPGTVSSETPSIDEPLAPVRRFVIKRDVGSHLVFVFRNSFGGLDTVISTGQIKMSSSGDVAVFINDGTEEEVYNGWKEYIEVNSGYIRSKAERKLWFEFFRSLDRCLMREDGTAARIIIDEYKSEYILDELSSFTFKFHYAQDEDPRLVKDSGLDEYYINK